MTLRYASLCTGISCESVAWRPLSWTPVFFSEVDPFACALLAHHYPQVPNLGDMAEIDGRDWRGKVDVMIAGTPCQSFSVAGKRGSLADARGNLALVYGRIVNDADVPVSVWENVPGVLSTKDNAFGQFLGELVGAGGPLESGRPKGKWPGAGVAAGPRRVAAWRILDARYFGVAQRRRRVFVVSVRAGDRANPCAVLLEPESLPGNPAPGREAGADVARSLTGSTGGASAKEQQLTFVSGTGEPLNALPLEAGTLCSQKKGGLAGRDALRGHIVPVAFSAKDHGADAGEQSPTLRAMPHDRSHMNGGGQVAVALSTSLTPKWSEETAFTLLQPSCSGGGQPQAVAHAYPLQEVGRRPAQNGSGVGARNGPMFTLQAHSQHGVAHTLEGESEDASDDGSVPPPQAYPLQEIGKRTGVSTEDCRAGIGIGDVDDPMYTLQSEARHGVAHTLRGEGHDASEDGTGRGVPLAVALRGRGCGNTAELGDGTAHALRSGTGGSDKPHVMTEMAVRRLTPRECESLQGLPPDYTLIPYGKGNRQKDIAEMAAYWGVSESEAATLAADSHRYRAIGNGMASPVVRWIGQRIEWVLRMTGFQHAAALPGLLAGADVVTGDPARA